MPTWNSLAAFGASLDQLNRELTTTEKRKITHAMGVQAEVIAASAARHDLGGDRAFSGWTRSQRIPLDTRTRTVSGGATLITPTRSSAGPWTVAERGRNQGNAGGFAGPGINTRTGLTARTKSGAVRKVRARQARRWNGTTIGKRTATDATTVMERVLPKIAGVAVTVVARKHFDVT